MSVKQTINPAKLFLGSCAEDKFGAGHILTGDQIRYKENDCWEIWNEHNSVYIECTDIVRILPNGDVEFLNTSHY